MAMLSFFCLQFFLRTICELELLDHIEVGCSTAAGR
jgi:hypothetical protein